MSAGPDPDIVGLAQARRDADTAKERMMTTLGALKQRASPKTIAKDATAMVRSRSEAAGDRVGAIAQARPTAFGVGVGLLSVVMLRKPLRRIIRAVARRSHSKRQAARLASTQTELKE